MANVEKVSIGVQSFEKLRRNAFRYVDKTQYIYQLISQGCIYFLSRPRRFGKSLFLSTLAAYFRGQKELFDGLYLEEAEKELAIEENRQPWVSYPVLFLDLTVRNYRTESDLREHLSIKLQEWEEEYGLEKISEAPEERFAYIVRKIYANTGQQVVILVDEYDNPLFETMNDPEVNEIYRDILRSFYTVIKAYDQYIRFTMLVGITKFSKISVFSGLNNLEDISLLPTYAGICGITEKELKANYADSIVEFATKLECTKDELLGLLRKKYDGYLFNEEGEHVYNPFSLLNALKSRKLDNFWFRTGTPTFLIKYLQKTQYFIPALDNNVYLDEYEFDQHRADIQAPIPLLFQTGYLTIKEYVVEDQRYRLGFPNDEVRLGFLKRLCEQYPPVFNDLRLSSLDFKRKIQEGNVPAFMTQIQSLLARLPYDTAPKDALQPRERNYQIAIFLIFELLGEFVQTEVITNSGRADCVVVTATIVYIFEFKLWSAGTPEDALAQIREKGYAIPYKALNKTIILVGVSFDEKTHNIGAWRQETF